MPLTVRTAEVVAVTLANDGAANEVNAILRNNSWQSTGAAAPTTGSWLRGQIVWNTAPSAGGVPGWVCVTSGSPGTWKALGVLAS
jgi:hypothetical protein